MAEVLAGVVIGAIWVITGTVIEPDLITFDLEYFFLFYGGIASVFKIWNVTPGICMNLGNFHWKIISSNISQ